ncbi:hypothetical protein ANCDUO_10155 [Ancylostoma duodenale]|uniref:Serine/threonine specific protein phosphatases domain-containing protein n=1 Tax=Ancylostoma duodenale TaxID=51022 RepID=A0A0C2GRJ2_9BILA|nr:hypothetical protein ANCDUO_10155 [Ancylostoma duodenale]
MPLCAVVSNRLLCMHGGISPDIHNWDSLHNLQKPKTPRACDDGIAVDLMWSDPSVDSCTGFQFNATRATSYIFGGDTIANICQLLDIALVVRAHEVVKGGHQFMFDRKLVTIFSAPNYCGTDGNAASVMKVSRKMELSFVTLKPRMDTSRLTEEKRLLLEKMAIESAAKSPDPCKPSSGWTGLFAGDLMRLVGGDMQVADGVSRGARPPSTAAADNKKKAIVNDDCMIGPVDIFGADTQPKPKTGSDNGGQPNSEVVPLGNGPSTKQLAKEKPKFVTSDVFEPPAMNIPVAPEPKPKLTVESVERKGGEAKDIVASGAQLDPGVKKPPKPPGTTVPKSSSPKKREPTTVPLGLSPQGAREPPKGAFSTAGSASTSQKGALSGNDRNGAAGTTTRITKVPTVPPLSPTNSRYKPPGKELPGSRMINPTKPALTSPLTKRYEPPTSPMQYTSTSQANQRDSSSFTSPVVIESESSSLSTASDRLTRTAKPPSPTTARLSSPTKARSVGEATKAAIAATKVPHPPNAKNPKEIINATEKALRPPSLSAPKK